MPRPLFDSPYLYGFHDPGGEYLMADAGRRGWIVFTMAIGSDPNDYSGYDFTPWSNQDFGIICRINNGYGSAGTIPTSDLYPAFAQRVANFVAASPGCKIWAIGNEMNHSQEWPERAAVSRAVASSRAVAPALQPELRGPTADPWGRSSPTRFSALATPPVAQATPRSDFRAAVRAVTAEKITPELYARCFRLCRDAIKQRPGHGDDQVVIGAVAPWNNQVAYPTNPTGDWVIYFQDILALLGAGGLDGITLHTYTHGSDPNLIFDQSTMNPPFANRHYNFIAYQDFMGAIPAALRTLPVYITETDQDVPWLDANSGWVRAAYGEINNWNKEAGNQQIRALVLYRWPPYDQWFIQGKQGVIDDFRGALVNGYQWQQPLPAPADFVAGDVLKTLTFVNFRQSPGGAVLATLQPDARLIVVDSVYVRTPDGLVWWKVRPEQGAGAGWVAQFTATGLALVEEVKSSQPVGSFRPGDQVRTLTIVRMRRTPGSVNKPAGDVVYDWPAGSELTVLSGPEQADNMTWWRNSGRAPDGVIRNGWMAEALANGQKLLEKVVKVPEPPAILPPPPTFVPGDGFVTGKIVNLRATPGTTNKPPADIVAQIPAGSAGMVTGAAQLLDDLTWWPVNIADGSGAQQRGWMAEALADGTVLMEPVPPPPPAANYAPNDLPLVADYANVRRTPGYVDKPADDVLGMFEPKTVVNVLSGPEAQDELTWWRVGGILRPGGEVKGWVAERAPGEVRMLVDAPKLTGTNIPDKASGAYLAAPFDGNYGISQLWGENSDFYGQFNYDGVALLGHNGIDFLTPSGTILYAVDGGQVTQAGFEPGGFGNYILLRHPWGESIYAHLDSVGVAPGQAVGRGQYLGASGNSGGSSGPHLHFALRLDPYSRQDGWGGFTNPLPYLPPVSFTLPPYVLDPAQLRIAASVPQPRAATRQAPPSMGLIPGEQRP